LDQARRIRVLACVWTTSEVGAVSSGVMVLNTVFTVCGRPQRALSTSRGGRVEGKIWVVGGTRRVVVGHEVAGAHS
jgi:hypothetical protein